jgi:ribose 1,5-bisphosphokinase PhnN
MSNELQDLLVRQRESEDEIERRLDRLKQRFNINIDDSGDVEFFFLSQILSKKNII